MSADIKKWRDRLDRDGCFVSGSYGDAVGTCHSGTSAEIAARDAEIAELRAALAAKTEGPADPMDWPLPCDVKVGCGTHGKGTKLRGLVERMQRLYDALRRADDPTPATTVEPIVVAWGKESRITGQINGVSLSEDCELRSQKLVPLGRIVPAISDPTDWLKGVPPLWPQQKDGESAMLMNRGQTVTYIDKAGLEFLRVEGQCTAYAAPRPGRMPFLISARESSEWKNRWDDAIEQAAVFMDTFKNPDNLDFGKAIRAMKYSSAVPSPMDADSVKMTVLLDKVSTLPTPKPPAANKALDRADLREFCDKFCLGKSELVATAEAAYSYFNQKLAQAGDKEEL